METSESLEKGRIGNRQKLPIRSRPTRELILYLSLLLVVSLGFNIGQFLWNSSNGSDHSDYEPAFSFPIHRFLLIFPKMSPQAVSLSCRTCAPWTMKFLHLAHLLRFQIPISPWPGSEIRENPNSETTGTVELFSDVGVIKISFQEVLSYMDNSGMPYFRFEGFINSTARRAETKAEYLDPEMGSDCSFAENMGMLLESAFTAFGDIMSLESVRVLGGSQELQIIWGEVWISLNKTGKIEQIEEEFMGLEKEIEDMCSCMYMEAKECANGVQNEKLGSECQISQRFLPILNVDKNPCSGMDSKDHPDFED